MAEIVKPHVLDLALAPDPVPETKVRSAVRAPAPDRFLYRPLSSMPRRASQPGSRRLRGRPTSTVSTTARHRHAFPCPQYLRWPLWRRSDWSTPIRWDFGPMRLAGRYCFTAIHANIALSKTKQGFGLMTKGPESATGRLSALVAEIEAEAYARGLADARREIRAALGAAGESPPRPRRGSPRAARRARKPRANGGKRAPRGSTRALMERALRDRPEADGGGSPEPRRDRRGTAGQAFVDPGRAAHGTAAGPV